MNPQDSQKILLNSTCTVSLHDRFTSLLKHEPADVMDITAAVNQQTAASLKNQRLALEMANRPSVLAALHNTSNINNQLCKVSVKARLGCPMGRGGMMGLQGQKRGGGGGGRSGLVKGFYTRKSGGRFTSVSRTHSGTHSGCSRARFDSHQIPSREQLDEQLDEYMSMTKSHLDAELDAYMAEVDLGDSV
ncbi:chromatin target of PRMT1b [Sinocyclocheilus anshuiensis]|uniref:chromatin target of PRMT1b n=1 Tax=Sinocyclocheilus anshuiensis TaxID=1608454 RepID=UPI0007B91B25|nr:PREDICTED: chromatin target of PRMT1 protein-like [Sinocyclocheilus anshuiensis]XP_016343575.1 PREDICTED: chromatin target of PRMT1 protein-like [Sinocyclocheilus anshuiensis]XP_016343576.1 PREDICTED: chromatin target of PRMT1 protein-like [Sinocyclocheilus anshuiensis]